MTTADPDAARRAHLKARYGLAPAQYDDILAAQGGGCGICGRKPKGRRLPVDHDHRTGEVFGILCDACNYHLLGRCGRNPARYAATAAYLTNPPARAILNRVPDAQGGDDGSPI
jgi:hypothetical protein